MGKFKLARFVEEDGWWLITKDDRIIDVFKSGERARDVLDILNDTVPRIKAPRITFDFEAIYKIYPRKEGKTDGLRWLKNNVKSQKAYDEVMAALRFHEPELRTREVKFIPLFSTWVRRYPDVVERMNGRHVEAEHTTLDLIFGEKL